MYKIGRLVRKGGQAYVRSGVDLETGEMVAIKIYRKKLMKVSDLYYVR